MIINLHNMNRKQRTDLLRSLQFVDKSKQVYSTETWLKWICLINFSCIGLFVLAALIGGIGYLLQMNSL